MSTTRFLKQFPYATTQKTSSQPWNSIIKISPQKKRFYKNKNRFFSMEYRRPISKRLLWQIAVPQNVLTFQQLCDFPYKTNKIKNTEFPKLEKDFKFTTFQYPWNLFRSVFFGKMWLLKNPSLVPGVVWPVKSKKINIAKMRAFKALTHLTGQNKRNFLNNQLVKFWNVSSLTKPSLWSMAASIESLKTNILIKSGFVNLISTANHQIKYTKQVNNGNINHKSLKFQYPGDFWQLTNWFANNESTNLLVKLWLVGPFKQNKNITKYSLASLYTMKPFIWLNTFFSLPFYSQKKISKKQSKFKRF